MVSFCVVSPFRLNENLLDTSLIITLLTTAGVFVFAVLYSNAGQGGSTGYAAMILLFGTSPAVLKPTALALNILVAIVVTIRSYRSGRFRWNIFWPFAVASFPVAFLVAYTKVKPFTYLWVLALVLVYAAVRLFFGLGMTNEKKTRPVPIWISIPAGAAIGLLAGFAGVGGGIFLTPLLLLMRWAKTREAIGVAGPLVLINSIIVFTLSEPERPLLVANMVYWAPAAFIGAWIGSEADMRMIPVGAISKAMALVIIAAALKLMSSII
jgi:uncharacterized membrane protein YfcA